MYGLAVNLTMSVSGHPSIINEITMQVNLGSLKLYRCMNLRLHIDMEV